MKDAKYYVDYLQMQAHPEGGFFRETYRAAEIISADALPTRFTGDRNFSTAIYYLLEQGDFSAFHRIKSDECWHFYAGETLLIHVIDDQANYSVLRLGKDLFAGDSFQFVVPATAWFAAEPTINSAFSLVGCTVAPGFDFEDFELADKEVMLSNYPQHKDVIERLCRV